MEKQNKRVFKTKRAIRRAYAELLCAKNVNEITVSEIAERAEVCRKTFYYYYEGVWAVEEDLENEVSAMVEKAIDETSRDRNINSPQVIFEIIINVIKTDPELISNLFKSEKNYSLLHKITQLVATRFSKTINEFFAVKPVLTDIFSELYVAGLISAFRKWLSSKEKLPIEELSAEIGKVVFNGLSAFRKEN